MRLRIACLMTVLATLILLASSTAALTFSNPQPLLANGRNYTPHIAYGPADTWINVWQSRATLAGVNDSESDILISRSTNLGQSWSSPAPLLPQLASDTAEDGDPRLIHIGNGTWILAHLTREPTAVGTGTDLDLLVTRSTSNGTTWSATVPLNSTALTDNRIDARVELAANASGVVIAVWQSATATGAPVQSSDIAFSRSLDFGATWSPIAFINPTPAPNLIFNFTPHIATDGNGRWIIIWSSNDSLSGTTGNDNDILFSTSLNNGQSWSAPAPLNTLATTDTGGDSEPRITCDASGNWVAVWYSNETLGGTIGTDSDIFTARSPDGITWSSAQPLNRNAAIDSGGDVFPRLVTDNLGNWLAYWCSSSLPAGPGNSGDTNLHFARSVNAGETWTVPVYLNTDATTDSRDDYNCDIATDSAGQWLATWGLVGSANPGPIFTAHLEAFSLEAAVSPAVWLQME